MAAGSGPALSRDELCSQYLDQLPFDPYPVQEEALLAWFTSEEGVLVCAPTGTDKKAIAATENPASLGSPVIITSPTEMVRCSVTLIRRRCTSRRRPRMPSTGPKTRIGLE